MATLNNQRHGMFGTFGIPTVRVGGGGAVRSLPAYNYLYPDRTPFLGRSFHAIDANADANRPGVSFVRMIPRAAPRSIPFSDRGFLGRAGGIIGPIVTPFATNEPFNGANQ